MWTLVVDTVLGNAKALYVSGILVETCSGKTLEEHFPVGCLRREASSRPAE